MNETNTILDKDQALRELVAEAHGWVEKVTINDDGIEQRLSISPDGKEYNHSITSQGYARRRLPNRGDYPFSPHYTKDRDIILNIIYDFNDDKLYDFEDFLTALHVENSLRATAVDLCKAYLNVIYNWSIEEVEEAIQKKAIENLSMGL